MRQHQPDTFYGAGEEGLHALTHTADWEGGQTVYRPRLTVPVPWEQAHPYAVVSRLDPTTKGSWPSAPVEEVDPRGLRASQRALTTSGLEHYFNHSGSDFADLYDKTRGPSNLLPLVYRSTDAGYPHDILLSGHHRATTALLRGQQLRARVVRGGLTSR